MTSSSVGKNVPVLQSDSIKAMSPVSQEIARMLQEAGYIEIIEPAGVKSP